MDQFSFIVWLRRQYPGIAVSASQEAVCYRIPQSSDDISVRCTACVHEKDGQHPCWIVEAQSWCALKDAVQKRQAAEQVSYDQRPDDDNPSCIDLSALRQQRMSE